MRIALPTVITRARLTAFNLLLPLAALLVWAGLAVPVAMADCQTQATEARLLLDTTIQQANQNAHPNPNAFATDFEAAVKQLQENKCMPELMGLIQHIQSEQQKLPVMAETKPSPMAPTENPEKEKATPEEQKEETPH